MSDNKTHIGIRIFKVIGWTLLGLVLLAIVTRLSLKTSPVHTLVKNKAVSIANQQLNGTLSIDKIDGDLWKDFSVTGITLIQDDTLASFDSLSITYDIWSLLYGTFKSSYIHISGLNASIIENPDSTFNIQTLVKEQTSPAPKETESSSFGIDLEQIHVKNSSVFVQSGSYLPDSTLRIKELNASGGFSFYEDISASLSSLSFKLIEGRLPAPIAFETVASYEDEEITLNRLVIETSRSLLKANGRGNLQDSTLQAEIQTIPFSLQDIQPYLNSDIPLQELQLSLKVGGNADSMHVQVNAEGEGFDNFLANSDLSLSGTPALTKLGISAQNLDIGYFTNDSVDAEIQSFRANLEGRISQDLPAASATWDFTINEIRYQNYRFETLFGNGTLMDGQFLGNAQLNDGDDIIVVHPSIKGAFSNRPSWELPIDISNLDLSKWLQNPDFEGELFLKIDVRGEGFELSERPWTYDIQIPQDPGYAVDTLTINKQKISALSFKGSISKDSVKANGFFKLIDNKISVTAALADYTSDEPTYSYQLETDNFNATEVTGFEDFPTRIDLQAYGSGRYFDPEILELQANLLVDSSFVNGASFDRLEIKANLESYILEVSEGELVSEMIDASFTGRRNLLNQTDPQNSFMLDMEVKNLQPLASLTGAQTLGATGTIAGSITETDIGELLFDGSLQLHDINYDTLFSANTISGNAQISIEDEYGYDLSLDIIEPTYNNLSLQDIAIETAGTVTEDSASGSFNLEIVSDEAGEISQAGSFDLHLETLRTQILWDTFNFQTPARLLSLQSPFQLTYQDAAIQTDTLELISKGGTYLSLAIPYADSLNQEIIARGRDFDFGVIQEIIFDERFVNGVLSGALSFKNSPEELTGNGSVVINNLEYKGTDVDVMSLEYNLVSERLMAQLELIMNGEQKVFSKIDVPFTTTDRANLGDAFYAEPVNGEFVINPIQLNEFQSVLDFYDVTATEGIISFNGNLSGTAGEPNFEGILKLDDPTLSGIKIDSAFAEFRYHHLEKSVASKAEIIARGQTAASIQSQLPISMDFRTFKLDMPGKTDSLTIDLLTDNFNISVFNDFLDDRYMHKLQGTLNADIDIKGTSNTLTPKGFFRLQKGQLSVPIAGITLTDINSELTFNNTGLQLVRLNARSGSGSFNASGNIDLEGIIPTDLNITAKATRFRLANTADYNLTIDLDSRLTGKPTRPKASGELRVKNGFVYLQDFGENSVEAVELEGEELSSFSVYDSLAIDMQFVIERNFLIRNERYLDMEIALTGELDAQKQTNNDLQLFGSLIAERGYVRPLGKQFTLDEGTFTFSGPITEPELFIKTSYVPQTAQKQGDPIVLYYIIEGTAEDPDFRFDSDPQMEQQDIICYTLFNKPCYALESWQQVVSGSGGSSPTDLLVDVLLDEFETLATQQLGIDVVQIDNSGANGGTSIKTGWYLNRRTFFAIINEISGTTPETLFILEYLLTENLDLIITQGDENRQGIDIRWHYDY